MQSEILTPMLPGSTRYASAYAARDVVVMIFRRRRLMGLAFCAVMLGFVIARFSHHQYTAEMRFLVQQARLDPVITAGSGSSNTPAYRGQVTEEQLNSEVELL